jgi:Ran GTPase-activating protein (RanGAP) involved in mRNA processing and transport
MLVLYDNRIDDETCLILADVIRNNNNIRHLDLRDYKIGDKGMKAISDALKNNHSLEELFLNNNQILGDYIVEETSYDFAFTATSALDNTSPLVPGLT